MMITGVMIRGAIDTGVLLSKGHLGHIAGIKNELISIEYASIHLPRLHIQTILTSLNSSDKTGQIWFPRAQE